MFLHASGAQGPIFDLFEWWGKTFAGRLINYDMWTFPIVETIHMIGIVLVVGTAAIVDMRLMGWRLAGTPAGELAGAVSRWARLGLVLVLTTGPLLLASDPDRYYVSYPFRFKMSALFLVLLFDFWTHRRLRSANAPSLAFQKWVGGISLILWTSVVAGGRTIGLFEE